jgi:hypothetical protein
LIMALLALVLYFLRIPLLRGWAGLLVVEQEIEPAEFVMLAESGWHHEEAAQLCRDGLAKRVLVIEGQARRTQQLGLLPAGADFARVGMAEQGIDGKVMAIEIEGHTDWGRVRRLGQLLEEQPEARVTVLVSRFGSRRWRSLVDRILPADQAERVRVRGVAVYPHDETNWWRSKEGVLDIFNATLAYGFGRLNGEDRDGPMWDPDQYEQELSR